MIILTKWWVIITNVKGVVMVFSFPFVFFFAPFGHSLPLSFPSMFVSTGSLSFKKEQKLSEDIFFLILSTSQHGILKAH